LGPLASEPITGKIRSMLSLVDDTIDGVRRISSDLRPPVLDRLGLIAALEWAADDFSHRSGIRAAVTSEIHETPLDRGRSAAVFRIVQEALTNAATHSQAKTIEISVEMTTGGRMVIEVMDDGVGLPEDARTSGGSLGLIGMRERASLLDGTVAIRPGAE